MYLNPKIDETISKDRPDLRIIKFKYCEKTTKFENISHLLMKSLT